jgi:acyl-CoA thioesterase FadM
MSRVIDPEGASQEELRRQLEIDDPRVFVWARRLAYFYCGFFRWAQHSAYLRLLEEVSDRFFDHIGLSIGTMLRERRWIPVVQEHALDVLENVETDEIVYTTFRVTDVIASRLFRAQVRWLVIREDRVLQVAYGGIAHGYVEVRDPEWESQLVRFDAETLDRLEEWATRSPAGLVRFETAGDRPRPSWV